MSDIAFESFVSKQRPVQAVRVTPINIKDLAEECGGELRHDGEKESNYSRDYIKVNVQWARDKRQTEAHVGDWLVKQGKSWKIFQDHNFRNSFELADGRAITPGNTPRGPVSEGRRPQKKRGKPNQGPKGKGPTPAHMPKKRAEQPAAIPADEARREVLAGELADLIMNGASQAEISKKVNSNLVEMGVDPELAEQTTAKIEKAGKSEVTVEEHFAKIEEPKATELHRIHADGVDVIDGNGNTIDTLPAPKTISLTELNKGAE